MSMRHVWPGRLLAFVMFLILLRNLSTSSEGCPEKFGKSLNRAFRALASNVGSAIFSILISLLRSVVSLFVIVSFLLIFLVVSDERDDTLVITEYEIRV